MYLKGNPDADRMRIATGVALGLEYLHFREIVHGDLKPVRVFLCAAFSH